MYLRVGTGLDAHRFSEGRKLVLGGVEIPHSAGLEGHSDADVVCHALIDAMLGAAAMGDIGAHFPDTEPEWKDADSMELLRKTAAMLEAEGWVVNNVDLTVIAESPRLAHFIDDMRSNLAEALKVDISAVSVKATTVEGMGAIGRKEGIAVLSVATIMKGDNIEAV